jgi:hypothetical protein
MPLVDFKARGAGASQAKKNGRWEGYAKNPFAQGMGAEPSGKTMWQRQ